MIEPMAVIPVIVTPIRFVLLPWPWSRPAMPPPSRRLHSPFVDAGSASAMKAVQDDMAWRDAPPALQNSEKTHPAVNLHNLAGHESRARRAEEQHALRHIVRRAFTAQRRGLDN